MKILLLGDLHIWNYPDYNLEPNFRLNQFEQLAYRLVEIGNQYNCERVGFLGDIVHRAICPPRVEHTTKNFFNILNTKWTKDEIWYILGNHDKGEKRSDTVFEESSVPVILSDNATYMHKKVINVDGCKIAFMDWLPVQDLGFINEQVDLFLGHVTLDEMFGQEIDNSKFKLGIVGDIHRVVNIDNLHSTNVPIPHYISDCQEGSVIVYDTNTGTFERVKTESTNFRHLKIYYDDVKNVDFSDFLTMQVKRPTKITSAYVAQKSIDVDKVIQSVIEDHNLSDIHSNFLTTVLAEDTKPVDLNFTIRQIKIKNFLSIGELDLDFPVGFVKLSGSNGVGKSSLIRAIDFAFRPPRTAKDFVKLGEKNLEIVVEFDYKERTHRIERVAGSQSLVKYFVDGIEQTTNSIADTNKLIESNLEFLELFDILYRYQSAPYLLSGFNYSQRIDLVSKLLGLSKVDLFYKSATDSLKHFKGTKDSLNVDIKVQSEVVNVLGEKDYSSLDKIDSISILIEKLKSDLTSLNLEIDKVRQFNEEATLKNKKSDELQAEFDYLTSKTSSIYGELAKINLPEIKSQIEEGAKVKSNFDTEYFSVVNDLSKIESEIININQKILNAKKELDSVNLNSKICSSCGREFDNAQEIQNHYDKVLETYNVVKAESEIILANLNVKKSVLNTRKLELQTNITEINTILSGLQVSEIKATTLKGELDDLTQRLSNFDPTEIQKIELIDISTLLSDKVKLQTEINFQESSVSQLSSLKADLDRLLKAKEKINSIEKDISELDQLILKVEKYKELFHPTGAIIKSIFSTVAELLTENEFVVRTVKTLKSGEDRIDFDVDYKVGNYLIPYQNLSGGQKVIVDIFFLSKLFKMSGQVGLLMLDETLKDLDTNNLEKAVKIIKDSPISTVLLVTHIESFNHYDLNFNVSMLGGSSSYQLEG